MWQTTEEVCAAHAAVPDDADAQDDFVKDLNDYLQPLWVSHRSVMAKVRVSGRTPGVDLAFCWTITRTSRGQVCVLTSNEVDENGRPVVPITQSWADFAGRVTRAATAAAFSALPDLVLAVCAAVLVAEIS